MLIFFGLWWLASEANQVVRVLNPQLVPSPWQVVGAGVEMFQRGWLVEDTRISMMRAVGGFAIAAVAAVTLGVVSGFFRSVNYFVEPVIELLRPIPPLAFLPMFIVWFGIGETPKVLFIAYTSFFPIFVNTYTGVRYGDALLLRAARSLGANRLQLLRHIVVPNALPHILSGLRLGIAFSLFVLVAAELIVAQAGLGYRIQWARLTFRVDVMFFGAFMLGIIGFLVNSAVRKLESHVLQYRLESKDRT